MEDDKGGINGEDGNLTWGGEYTIQCTDNVLWNCAPETCIILLTSVICNKFNKKRKKLWHLYTYYLTIKNKGKENLTFCNNMDRPGEYYIT